MYNPFPLLNEQILQDRLQAGRRWFVRQSYPRGACSRQSFLFRSYADEETEQARTHLRQLDKDPYARLYDARDPGDLERLCRAATQPEGYCIYYAGSMRSDWRPSPAYEARIKNYIRTYHSHWRSGKKGNRIEVGLLEQYGFLFIKLSYEEEEEIIPFELIEKT